MAGIQAGYNIHFPSFQHTVTIELRYTTAQWSLSDYPPKEILSYLNYVKKKLAAQMRYPVKERGYWMIDEFNDLPLKRGEAVWGREQIKNSRARNLWMPVVIKDLKKVEKVIKNYVNKRGTSLTPVQPGVLFP